jgi:hypothetical protein
VLRLFQSGGNFQWTLNSNTGRVGLWFRLPAGGGSVTGARINSDGVGGTPTDIGVLELYATDGFLPAGSPLRSVVFTPANGWFNVIFGSAYDGSAGEALALILRNQSGNPGTNWYRPRFGASPCNPFPCLDSSNGGASWSIASDARVCMAPMLGGSVWSDACATSSFESGTGMRLYNVSGSRVGRAGMRFDTAPVRLLGCRFGLTTYGSPTPYPFVVEALDSGNNVVAVSSSVTPPASSTAQFEVAFSDRPVMSGTWSLAIRGLPDDCGSATDGYFSTIALANSWAVVPASFGPLIRGVESTAVAPAMTDSSWQYSVAAWVQPAATVSSASKPLNLGGGFTL